MGLFFTTTEIDAEQDPEKREKMKALIPDYGISFLEVTPEAERLAIPARAN
jgi:hypothetical protein